MIKARNYGMILSCSDELIEDYKTKKDLQQAMKDWKQEYKKVFPELNHAPAVHMAKWNGIYWQKI